MTQYQISDNDVPIFFESLNELFHEKGSEATPLDLSNRMQEKLGRRITYRYASWLLSCFGFITMSTDGKRAYIVLDYEHLRKVRR